MALCARERLMLAGERQLCFAVIEFRPVPTGGCVAKFAIGVAPGMIFRRRLMATFACV